MKAKKTFYYILSEKCDLRQHPSGKMMKVETGKSEILFISQDEAEVRKLFKTMSQPEDGIISVKQTTLNV